MLLAYTKISQITSAVKICGKMPVYLGKLNIKIENVPLSFIFLHIFKDVCSSLAL